MSYFPKLKKQPKQGQDASDEPETLFNFTARLKSSANFKQVCHPKGFDIVENELNDIVV